MGLSICQTWLGAAVITDNSYAITSVQFLSSITGLDESNPVDKDLLRQTLSVIELAETDPYTVDICYPCKSTPFQIMVWEEIRKIPFGHTISYLELAKRLGKPKSFRAVANACGANQIGVLVPCHRVLRSNGDLGGYRWGLDRKRSLLHREAACLENKVLEY